MAEREKRRATTFRTSKGTIVNVQYPDIYVSPAFLSTEDVTNPTEMRDALREELRNALLRRETVESFVSRTFLPSDKDSDIGCLYPITDDEIIYANTVAATPHIVRRNLQTGTESWRVTGYSVPFGFDYDNINGRIALGYESGILILNASTGALIQNITSFGGNSLAGGIIRDVVWRPDDLNKILFVVTARHVVVELDIVTGANRVFGTWNTSGSTLALLHSPFDVEINQPDDDFFIVDTVNNRVMRVTLSDFSTVKDLMLMQNPYCIRKLRWGVSATQRYYPIIVSGPGFQIDQLSYTFAYNRSRKLLWSIPRSLEYPRFNPDLTRMWGAEIFGMEYDLRRLANKFISRPDSATLLNNEAVLDAGWVSAPIAGILFGDMSVELYSSQAGNFYIDVPNSNSYYGFGLGVPTTYTWVQYDTLAVAAATMMVYNFTRKPPLFRLRFDPTGDAAAVTLRLNTEPKSQV